MRQIIDTPKASLIAGCILAVALLVLRLIASDAIEVFAFLVRLLHILAAMVWVGLIVFVNFVQLVALQGADDQVRGFFAKSVVPQVAAMDADPARIRLWFHGAPRAESGDPDGRRTLRP